MTNLTHSEQNFYIKVKKFPIDFLYQTRLVEIIQKKGIFGLGHPLLGNTWSRKEGVLRIRYICVRGKFGQIYVIFKLD